MTIVRIWRTRIDPRRSLEYERFALDISLPMFRQQQGFLGVLFAGTGADRIVVSFWKDADAVAALTRSPSYTATVARITGAGFLRGDSQTDVYPVHGGTWPTSADLHEQRGDA